MDPSFLAMGNDISVKQNTEKQINRLAAQRSLYTRAKTISSLQLLITAVVVSALAVFAIVVESNDLLSNHRALRENIPWIMATVGVFTALLDLLLLTPIITKIKGTAAKTQELFDTDVLTMDWNEIAAGVKPDEEDILAWGNRVCKDPDKVAQLKDWYSTKLDSLTINAARFVCQRSNLWWDADIRKFYVTVVTCLVTLSILLLVSASLWNGLTFRDVFLEIAAPALPLIIYAYRQWKENGEAVARLTRLKELLNVTWKKYLSENMTDVECHDASRKLQDQIFSNREANPLIPDFIYNLRKSSQHDSMAYSIDDMISEMGNSSAN